MLDLKTYAQTGTCIQPCDLYSLSSKNYERLVTKRNFSTVQMLRDRVKVKLQARISRMPNSKIPLLGFLLDKIQELENPKKDPFMVSSHEAENPRRLGESLGILARGKSREKITKSRASIRRVTTSEIPAGFEGGGGGLNDSTAARAEEGEGLNESTAAEMTVQFYDASGYKSIIDDPTVTQKPADLPWKNGPVVNINGFNKIKQRIRDWDSNVLAGPLLKTKDFVKSCRVYNDEVSAPSHSSTQNNTPLKKRPNLKMMTCILTHF